MFTREPRARATRRFPAGPPSVALTAGAGARPFSGSPPPYRIQRSMTGAARAINLQNRGEVDRMAKRRGADEWQIEAWEYYDSIGEVKYALSLVANVLSRIRLYAAEVSDPSQPPTQVNPDDPGGGAAIAALSRLDSAYGGQPGLMRDAGLNLQVAGECFLVQDPGNVFAGIPESWDIRSTDELQVDSSGNVTLQTQRLVTDASSKRRLPNKAFVARIWRPHPRYSDDADSSMRGILDLCSELLLLNRTFRSTARSRLNAGMLYLPDGLSVAAQADTEVLEGENGEIVVTDPAMPELDDSDEFEDALLEAMTTPISDEESAAAVVPLLVRGPAELADKIKQFKFERSFDAHLVARADRVLDRIMQGIDVPKDVVTGLANVKYANAVQIDESLYKAHIEPLTVLLCDALTVVYLRPALKAAGINESDLSKYVIWYDPSEVTTRPNRAEDADIGFTNHTISGAAWRRAHGFNDGDAPDPTEVAVRMLVEKGPVTPELTEALLTVIAPDVMAQVRQASQGASPAPLSPEILDALGGGPTEPAADEGTAPAPGSPPGGATPAPAAQPPAPPSAGAPVPGAPAVPDVVPTEDLI